MARTLAEFKAQMESKKAAAEAPAAPAPVATSATTAPASKPATTASKSAAPPAPPVTRTVEPVKAKREETAPIAPVELPKVEAPPTPKLVIPPDIMRPVDYKVFYDRVPGTVEGGVRAAASVFGVTPDEFRRVASAQGVDLDAIAEARKKGRSYDEVATAARERGVIGFLTPEDREASFRRVYDDVEKAVRGEAPDTIELKRAKADKGFGPAGALGGYVAAGTQAELPEVTKPGEHGYTVATLLIDALKDDAQASKVYDLYGRSLATGNTQKYIETRTEDLKRRAGISASQPDAVEKVAKLRRQAINEVIAYKTVGQWTPAITLGDIEVTEGREAPSFLGALKPNVEIIGFNNKRQAIFRQESPLGVLFRVIDIPQAAVSGVLMGQGATTGIQTGANFFEAALETTEGASPYVRYPVAGLGMAASVLAPDMLLVGGKAGKVARLAIDTARIRKIAPQVTDLLSTIAKSRAAQDFTAAKKAEIELRDLAPAVADQLDRYDASAAELMKLVDPTTDTAREDLTAIIGARIKAAEQEAAGRVWLHPSQRREVLEAKGKTKNTALADYDELFSTDKLLGRVAAARVAHEQSFPKTMAQYISNYAVGTTRDVLAPLAKATGLSAENIDRLSDIVRSVAPTALLSEAKFREQLQAALKADDTFKQDAFKGVRKALHVPGKGSLPNRMARKIKDIGSQTIDDLRQADLALLDRAAAAIEKNNEARAFAAAALMDEVASKGKLRVQPVNLFDDVAVLDKAGQPVRLSAAGQVFLKQLRRLMPDQDFTEAYRLAAVQDQIILSQAKRHGVDPFSLYKQKFPQFMRASEEDLARFGISKKVVPPTPTAPASPHGKKALKWSPKLGGPKVDVETVEAAKRYLLDARAGRYSSDAFATFARADGTVGSYVLVFGDVRIVADSPLDGDDFNIIVKVGTETVEKPSVAANPMQALLFGVQEAEPLMEARVAKGAPAIEGVPEKLFLRNYKAPATVAEDLGEVTEAMETPIVGELDDLINEADRIMRRYDEVAGTALRDRVRASVYAEAERVLEGQASLEGLRERVGRLAENLSNIRGQKAAPPSFGTLPQGARRLPPTAPEAARIRDVLKADPYASMDDLRDAFPMVDPTSLAKLRGEAQAPIIRRVKALSVDEMERSLDIAEDALTDVENALRTGRMTADDAARVRRQIGGYTEFIERELETRTVPSREVTAPVAAREVTETGLRPEREVTESLGRVEAARIARLQDELEQAVQQGDEVRQGELEMEIENLRRMAQPEAAPTPAAVEEVVEAPAAAPTVEAPAPTTAEPPTPAPIVAAAEAQPEVTIIPREVAQKLDAAKAAAPPPPPAPKGYSVMPNKGNDYEVPWTAYLSGKDSPDVRKVAATRDDLGVLITPYTASYVKQADAYPFFAVDNGVFAAKGFDPQKFEKLIDDVAALPEATRNKLLFVVAPDVLIKNPDGSVFGDAKGTLELFKQWGPKIRAKGLPVALVAQNGLEDMVDDIPWDDFDVLFIGGSTEWKIGDFSYIADPTARRATQDKWTKLFEAVYDNGKPIHMGRVSGPERLMRGGTEMGAATVDGTMLAVAPDQMMGKLIRMLDDLNVKGRVQLADQLYPDTGSVPDAEDFIALAQDSRVDVSDLDTFYRTVDEVAPGLVVNDTVPGLVNVAKAEKRRVYEEVRRLRDDTTPPVPAKRPRATRAKPPILPSIEPLARTAPSPWAEVPKRFVVAAEPRLRKAAEDLEAGRINVADYDVLVGDVRKNLTAQKAERAARKAAAPLERGASVVRARLLEAQAAGVIDEAGVDLADWLIRQNPRIADDLNVSILDPKSAKKRFKVDVGESVAGFYEPLERVVALIKERGSEQTAVHEILHHTEQMLPEALQTAVRDEWAKQIAKALRGATPEQRPALEKALTGQSTALLQGVVDGTLPRSFYQLVNPSEFWAVNASRIVSGRYATASKGLVAKAKQWLTEFVQKVKSAFGLSSDAPLIRGLDAVLKGEGTPVSNMLSEGDVFRAPTSIPVYRGGDVPDDVMAMAEELDAVGLDGSSSLKDWAENPRTWSADEYINRMVTDIRNGFENMRNSDPERVRSLEAELALWQAENAARDAGTSPLRPLEQAASMNDEQIEGMVERLEAELRVARNDLADDEMALNDMLNTAERMRARLKEEGIGTEVYEGVTSLFRSVEPKAADEVTETMGTDAGRLIRDTPVSTFKTVSPTGAVTGITEFMDDGRSIVYLMEGADASTVLDGMARVLRRNVVDVKDMDDVVAWLKTRGVTVGHQFGEFVGDPAEVQKAEDFFAKAFVQYALEGVSPSPALTDAFNGLKSTVANIYKVANDPVIGVQLQPQVRQVFDRVFADVTEQGGATLKQVLRRELVGEAEDEINIIDILSREAVRRGLPKAQTADLQKKFDDVVNATHARGERVSEATTVLDFPVPVMGKSTWTVGDLAEAQARRELKAQTERAAETGVDLDLLGRGRGKAGRIREETPVEFIRQALAPVEDEPALKAEVRSGLRMLASTFIGGDVALEKGVRELTPELRKAFDTGERVIEQHIGDAIAMLNDAVVRGSNKELLRYLAGSVDVRKMDGRPVISAGHDAMGAVLDMYRRSFASMDPALRTTLTQLADAVNSPNRGQAVANLGFDPTSGKPFAGVPAEMQATRDTAVKALDKILGLAEGTDDEAIGPALSKALRTAVDMPGSYRPSHEMRLAEVVTYLSGLTARPTAKGPRLFTGTSEQAAEILLKEAGGIYGSEEVSRRVAILVASFGSAQLGKDALMRMGLGINAKTREALVNWSVGKQPGVENINALSFTVSRYGADLDFVRDAVLDVDMYIPRMARDRMAKALARANYRPAGTTTAEDGFNVLYRYMKTRMTRGSFFIRQRYYMMNTVDHFTQISLQAGFGAGATSLARVLAQDLMVLPFWQQAYEAVRMLPFGKKLDPTFLERVRSGMTAKGDVWARRVGEWLSITKYHIEVNPILEGVDGGFRAGGKVYSYKTIRNIAVEEGVFASMATRELQSAIQREGTMFANAASNTITSASGKGAIINFLADWQKTVEDTAEAWGERERLGAMVTLMEMGHDPRMAARITVDALYDYSQSMTKMDRHFLVGVLFPFWAFQKNANQQVVNLIFSPWGAYRMMCIRRARERSADMLAEVLYNDVGGDYGLDVKSMPPELQDSYYAIVKAFEDSYGGEPPADAKRALRMLMQGRALTVEDGKFVELSSELQRLRTAGGFADLQRFADYTVMRPSKAERTGYLRERTGFAVPFPRTEAVRMYYRMAGDDHSYMEVFYPESVVEAGLKHITQIAAAQLLIASYGADLLPGIDLKSQGLREVSPFRVAAPVADITRSPIIAPLLAGTVEDLTAPKKVSKVFAAGAEGLVAVHPWIGQQLDEAFGTTFLRVPAIMDPLVRDPSQLSEEDIERIRELQKQYPDASTVRDQRYYIPAGVWAVAFENSPIGELNQMLLRYEANPLERTDDRGEMLRWARGVAGVDVEMTSASRAAKYEEPTKLKETKGI